MKWIWGCKYSDFYKTKIKKKISLKKGYEICGMPPIPTPELLADIASLWQLSSFLSIFPPVFLFLFLPLSFFLFPFFLSWSIRDNTFLMSPNMILEFSHYRFPAAITNLLSWNTSQVKLPSLGWINKTRTEGFQGTIRQLLFFFIC